MPGAWLPPGITIPNMVDGTLWYVQVRTTKAARQRRKRLGRYHALGGSVLNALYGANDLKRHKHQYMIIVEGELDQLLLAQEAAGLPVGVATMGSANCCPGAQWQVWFQGLRGLCLIMDRDAAGLAGETRWSQRFPWRTVVELPLEPGQDVGDFWQAGGDLRGMVETAVVEMQQGDCPIQSN